MSGTGVAPGSTFSFAKDGTFLDQKVSAGITVTADPGAAVALEADVPFTGTTSIASLRTSVSGATGNINFASAQNGVVSFSGSAGFNTGIGVYQNPSDLLKALDPDGTILAGISIDGTGIGQFLLLNWGYNISASASGSVALGGAGSVTFGADGSTDGLFAVIRGYPQALASRAAIQDLIDSWMLPSQVSSIDDLQPATWLIAEVDGAFGVKLGAQYGYNYNWIRKVTVGDGTGALSGDIGLKIQAAADVTLGFNTSGKYLVTVARESADPNSKIARVRLYKSAKKGWTFGFDASVGVTPSTGTLTPAQLDDFVNGLIQGVAGTHGAQIVDDLQKFDAWINPATPLPDLFAGFVSDYVTKELATIPAVQQLPEARAKIQGFLTQWENLGHTTSTMLWSAIDKAGGPVAELLNFLQTTNGLSTAGLKTAIETELGKVGFSSSPIGQWLQSVATTDLLSLLDDNAQLAQVQKAAGEVLDIANGKVLDDLIQYADQKLDIKQIENVISEADFNNLDPWLKSKLSAFLSKEVSFTDLDKIRATLQAIRNQAQQIYTEAVKALNTTYTAAFHYTYAKTATSTALIDVSFDFSQNAALGTALQSAVSGDFNAILLNDQPGISLGAATLTHGVTRQSHVQIVLPYFSDTIDHINQALTSMTVQSDGGRMFAYQTNANDQVILQGKWNSSLTITGKLTLPAGSTARNFTTDADLANGMSFHYSFRQASKAMPEAQLTNQIQPLQPIYFPNAFDAASTAVADWVGTLDRSAGNTAGNLGNTLFSLDVSLPGTVVAAWLKAPPKKGDQSAYAAMSRNIQIALRRFTSYCYFDDASKYVATPTASPIIFYQCLPVRNNNPDGTTTSANQIYWDVLNPAYVTAELNSQLTQNNWQSAAAGIFGILNDSAALHPDAGFYSPDSWGPRLQEAQGGVLLKNLLLAESTMISAAQSAGWSIADFVQTAGSDPDKAMSALSDFGAKVTSAFNEGLGGVFGGQAQQRMREFSSLIFLEAAKAFDPSLAGIQPMARLDVFLLRPSAPAAALTNFLNGTAPDASIVAIEQPVVGLPNG